VEQWPVGPADRREDAPRELLRRQLLGRHHHEDAAEDGVPGVPRNRRFGREWL
jgi:hypothetical protein